MSASPAPEGAGKVTFSDGETKLLLTMLANLKGDINTDWEEVANVLGYKDASIARTRWGQIRRKKIATNGGVIKSPATGEKKKPLRTPKKTKGGADDDENGADDESPTKKKKGRKTSKAKAKDENEDEDGAEAVATEGAPDEVVKMEGTD